MEEDDILLNNQSKRTIAARESSYQSQRTRGPLSPDRADAFKSKAQGDSRSYSEVMAETLIAKEKADLLLKLRKQRETQSQQEEVDEAPAPKKRRRWDVGGGGDETPTVSRSSEWEDDEQQPPVTAAKKSRWDVTPFVASGADSTSWAATPRVASGSGDDVKKSRWDETPVVGGGQETPRLSISSEDDDLASSATVFVDPRWARELEVRNKPWTDEDLDALLPSAGFKVLETPGSYVPIMTPARKLTATPMSQSAHDGFFMQEEQIRAQNLDMGMEASENLPMFKPEDVQYFGKLLDQKPEDEMSLEEAKERKIMRILLRIKNGTPQDRKMSFKELTERAQYFGAGPLFDHILPLLMSPSLEDQERHLLVKVIDRVLYKLDDLVRPYVHKILVVIEPLLIDEDYYARIEGREIISNLSKAAGLATMISVMRPDIDHVDEYVRNTTSRAFSVVASALGIQALLPFLTAVCKSKKSWQARHTGIKIVQQIAILMGCAVLPHLRGLVEAIGHGLGDENQKVRTITALALANLAEAAAPYGIESFDTVLRPIWNGIQKHRGKGLAAFVKAIGALIPLMDAEFAGWYTSKIMAVLVREFASPDEEMKKIVLKVVRQCAATEGITGVYVKEEILPEFFTHFWVRRMALDRRNYRQVVETTVALARKAGGLFIIEKIMHGLKDDAEPYRKMVMHAIQEIISELGSADIQDRNLELLMDNIQSAFQEQKSEDTQLLDGIGVIMRSLGPRCQPFLATICSTILWRLQNKSALIRQQAAELVARIASVLQECEEEGLLTHFGTVLYEYLGEEYPEVLGSVINGLKGIINVIGMSKMNPPIKDLLPRLTPILKNRHERVQEHTIDLIGRIADRGAEFVSAREWMRICFELLETLKAPRKSIRRAAINTFGYIAKAIGPQDVLTTLLNNLKVQERQNRLCTTIAIAIVSETCAPFTVLPALMNEYRMPDLNVQNGVLKSLAFMFEYIGEMAKDYVYALTPLLENALTDRDVVHRQTACTAVKHLAVGCYGLNCEDALHHLLNYVWPNIFEVAPHMMYAFMEAVEGLRLALGGGTMLMYLLQGLFHPARKTRDAYWKVYNSVYISSQEALVPFYPRIENELERTYERYELDYIL
eukprot:Partr_v1_DN28743_c1_g1_i3_m63054 putative Splicing factor 3b subunit